MFGYFWLSEEEKIPFRTEKLKQLHTLLHTCRLTLSKDGKVFLSIIVDKGTMNF